jgi:hypothetical protein
MIVDITGEQLTTKDVKQRDQAVHFVEAGDPGFSPERNKQVVERSILKYEAMRKAKNRQYEEQIGERAEAVAMYLKSNMANNGSPIEAYISERELARLRGQKRLEKMRTLANGQKIIEFIEL